MRAFAVLMMVQGHTVDTFLSNEYRTFDSPLFNFWVFMRGLTAPIFMFSAGTVFMYLLRLNNVPFSENPRVKKGIKRFFLLLGLGYLLRYPTPWIVYFKDISERQWQTFFTVDVLHLIGFSILFAIGLAFVAERYKIRDSIVFSTAAFLFFVLSPFFAKINWTAFLPVPIAGYFYYGTGSLFPLFPWAGFLIAGAALGSYLAKNPNIFKSKQFSYRLLGFGSMFILLSIVGNTIEVALYGGSTFWTTSPNLILFRLGIVLLLNSAVSYVAIRLDNIPALLIQIGRNTLPIYVVHLVILYGSPWTLGFSSILAQSLNVWSTVGAALLMLSLMVIMVKSFQVVKVVIKKREVFDTVRN